jgi:hypothetical protein
MGSHYGHPTESSVYNAMESTHPKGKMGSLGLPGHSLAMLDTIDLTLNDPL